MANQLTGDFDVVGQAGIKVVNNLARVMHQNGATETGLPEFPHQLWLHLVDESGSQPVDGSAWVQLGVPALELVLGAPSDIRVRCPIRARYVPEPGTKVLPEFVLGEVHARYSIVLETESGVLGLRAVASPDDQEIGFVPDAKQKPSKAQVAGFATALRGLLRTALPAFLPLPGEFQGAPPILRGLVDPSGAQAVAFPVSLSGSAGDPGSVTRVFAGSNEIAIAVAKEFILAPVQAQLDYLKAHPPKFSVKAVGYDVADYSVTITTATATWSEGMVITITVKGKAHTGSILPDASFSVTMKLKLTFSQGGLSVGAVGDPSVSVSVGGSLPGFVKNAVEDKAESTLKSRIIKERNNALATANPLVQQAFEQTNQLETLLRTIDDKAALSFYTADYDPDGLVLRGHVTLSLPKAARVTFSPLANGKGYTAFDSWIPGGTVRGFTWTWFSVANFLAAEPGKIEKRTLYDRFVIEEEGLPMHRTGQGPVLAMGYSQLCLQLIPTSGIAKLVPGATCGVPFHRGPDLRPPKQPVTWPDPAGRLHTIGRVDLGGLRDAPGANLLVQRVAGEPLADIVRRIEASASAAARPEAALTLALVVPEGSLRRVAAEAARIRRRAAQGSVDLLVVEDVDGSWSSTFDLRGGTRTGAWRLVDPEGRLVWRHDGMLDQKALAGALKEHLQPASRPSVELVGAGVRAGQDAPHFHFDGVSGGRLALNWLRGRLVVLVFAEPDAPPSRTALKRLKRLERAADRYGIFPLAVIDGGKESAARALRRDLHLGLPVVPDPDGWIGRRYGIRYWPTTVVIDRDGQIANVSLGAG